MRINPFISILFILLANLYQGVNAQIPAQNGSIKSLFSYNSPEQISTQVQKLFLEGLLAVNNTSFEEGLTLLLQAEELDRNQSGITYAIANIYFHLNDYDNALFYAENSLIIEPMNPWYKIQLAQILYAKGYYQAAVKELELILSKHKYHWAALTLLIDMHQKMSFLADANEVIRECILEPLQMAATPHSPRMSQPNKLPIQPFSQIHKDWYKLLYRNFELLGIPDSMETVASEMQYLFPYEQGVSKLAPKNDDEEISDNSRFTEATLNDADKYKPAPDKSESSLLFQKLQQNMTPNNPEEAIVWLHKLNDNEIGLIKRKTLVLEWNELFPEQGEILSELGWIELELDNQKAAKKWFEQAIRSPGPRSQKSEWYRQLGKLQAEAGDLKPAERSFSYALRYDSDNAYAWASFAYFKARYRNNRAEAESKIEQALSIKPEDATLIEIKGDIYHLFNESDEAVIWWVKALELGGPTQRIQQKLSGDHD